MTWDVHKALSLSKLKHCESAGVVWAIFLYFFIFIKVYYLLLNIYNYSCYKNIYFIYNLVVKYKLLKKYLLWIVSKFSDFFSFFLVLLCKMQCNIESTAI